MADGSKIEWTDATWNPITGCSVLTPGCTNCYAMKLAGTRLAHHPSRAGLTTMTKAGPVWNGEVRFNEGWLDQPLRWSRPRMVFVCAHGDLFHESVPDEWIDKVFAVMALCPQHTFQVLTKRAERMRQYMADLSEKRLHGKPRPPTSSDYEDLRRLLKAAGSEEEFYRWVEIATKPFAMPLPNVWLGVSAERQKEADERIPLLLQTPAAVRFVSLEPLLAPIDLSAATLEISLKLMGQFKPPPTIHWVIVGGESGRRARPMHPQWVRNLRDQCNLVAVPFFFKQWGEFKVSDVRGQPPLDVRWIRRPYPVSLLAVGKKAAGRELDGRTWDEMP